MTVECPKCHKSYDDAKHWTFCPHERFISDEAAARKDAAFKLLGKWVRFAHHTEPLKENERLLVTMIDGDGMVTVDKMDGYFAPHLFVVAETQ